YAAPFAPLLNLRNRVPALATLGEKLLGLSAQRSLPNWSSRPYRGATSAAEQSPLRPSGGRGRGPSRPRWEAEVGSLASALESPTSPQPSPPPPMDQRGAEREQEGAAGAAAR